MRLDPPDERDAAYAMTPGRPVPKTRRAVASAGVVDFSGEFPTAHNQHARGTCAVYAATACLEHKTQKYLSPSFASWAAVQQHDHVPNGVTPVQYHIYMRDAFKTLARIGACEHKYFTDEVPANVEPPAHCWHLTHRIKTYSAVRPGTGFTVESWIEWLLSYKIPIATTVYITTDWHDPELYGARDTVAGPEGHPVVTLHSGVLCGYKPGYWRFRNSSWGHAWGDRGSVWMSRAYRLYDAWAIGAAA